MSYHPITLSIEEMIYRRQIKHHGPLDTKMENPLQDSKKKKEVKKMIKFNCPHTRGGEWKVGEWK